MVSTLRVEPEQLRAAAAAQADVGAHVSSMGAGRSLTVAVQAMAGLEGGAACRDAAAVLDQAAREICAELTEHSDRLVSAADRYRTEDDELARRLRRIAD